MSFKIEILEATIDLCLRDRYAAIAIKIMESHKRSIFNDRFRLKWSCKIGQSVKVYSNEKKEYQNDEETEVFRPV